MYNLLLLCFLILILFPSTFLSSNPQNTSAQNTSAQNTSAQNTSAQNTSAQNTSAQIFRKTTQLAEGPKIINPNLHSYLVFEGVGFFSNMAFLGPDDILVIDKNNGTVQRIVNETLALQPLFDATVATKSERGMVGIAVSPKSTSNQEEDVNEQTSQKESNDDDNSINDKYVFLYFTEAKNHDGDDKEGNDPIGNRLYRYEFNNNSQLGNAKLLLDLPGMPGPAHDGGSIVIGPDNNLYLILGNVNEHERESYWTTAENYYYGKFPDGRSGILRIDKDGKPVNDEKVLGITFPLNLYFAYGIRNGFGLDFDPVTGNLWDTENGASYGDEINLVEPGFNSGWRKVQGIWEKQNGSSSIGNVTFNPIDLYDFNGKGKYSSPEFTWLTPVGVTGLRFLDSNKLGEQYENDMFVGDFHSGSLYHFDLDEKRTGLSLGGPLEDKVASNSTDLEKVIFGKGFGGITDVEVGPDGYLYVLALNTGGSNCVPKYPNAPCVPYDAPNVSRIFKILPSNNKGQ
jgi:glucose/arabinose dehydrogenase